MSPRLKRAALIAYALTAAGIVGWIAYDVFTQPPVQSPEKRTVKGTR